VAWFRPPHARSTTSVQLTGALLVLASGLILAACARSTPSVGPGGSIAGLASPAGGSPSPASAEATVSSPAPSAVGPSASTTAAPASPAASPTAIPASTLPALDLAINGRYVQAGLPGTVYAGTTLTYTFRTSSLVVKPATGDKVAVSGRLTVTDTQSSTTGLKCHGTFTATYSVSGSGTIGGMPWAPTYDVTFAVAHPPVDKMTLHCTIGTSVSTSPHGAIVGAWSGLLGPVSIPYQGGSIHLSGSTTEGYFSITAEATFTAHPA
jgi:hypothetical protein